MSEFMQQHLVHQTCVTKTPAQAGLFSSRPLVLQHTPAVDCLMPSSEGFTNYLPRSLEVPAHVFGLTTGGRNDVIFLLDTHLGIVHWVDCPNGVTTCPSQEPVDESKFPDDDWRRWPPSWAVADFFELLKDEFWALDLVTLNERIVFDTYAISAEEEKGLVPLLQTIYREHGWPNLNDHKTDACLDAVRDALKTHCPRFLDENFA